MNLFEFEGKKLFKKYGITVPRGVLLRRGALPPHIRSGIVKAQVRSGDRMKAGGIIKATTRAGISRAVKKILGSTIRGEKVEAVLVEETVDAAREYYASFSYDGSTRGPVLALNAEGGSGIKDARVTPIDLVWGIPDFFLQDALMSARFPAEDIAGVSAVLKKLWELFTREYALLAEINPLFKTKDGLFVAGDAKTILDDEKICPNERRYIDMDGDIAVLSSGGGASMLCMDELMRAGGRPGNYTEYSGNPKGDVVKELTKRVLSKPGLRACWVVGAAANFTDIYATLSGFLDGLREVEPKPAYPIVIRRDGPRRKEAFEMLREAGKKEGFDFHLYDSETPMAETANIVTKLAYRAAKKI